MRNEDEKRKKNYKEKSFMECELSKTRNKLVKNIIKIIQNDRKVKDFKMLVLDVFSSSDAVKVTRKDSVKDWDLLVEIAKPLMPNLITTIPVQCKNFTDKMITKKPIEDLERSIENYDTSIAYLIIMENFYDEFKKITKLVNRK